MDAPPTAPLTRLLVRLSSTLAPDSPQLPSSQYQRNKVAANVEHARTLLLTLEKQASTVRVQTQRQQIQADLQLKRETIKQLSARLEELNQLGDNDDEPDEEDEKDDETLSYAPARTDAQDGLETTSKHGQGVQMPEHLYNEIRARAKPPSASDNRSTASTTARESLFAGRSDQQSTADSNLAQSETLLSHNRTEQENLTTNLLSLARALKESSQNFGASLENEKDILKRAEGGLDKSAVGMEAAERKMGTLRRMSEGQGWLGRLKLYGMIGGLWVACFLLVFVGPKIRL